MIFVPLSTSGSGPSIIGMFAPLFHMKNPLPTGMQLATMNSSFVLPSLPPPIQNPRAPLHSLNCMRPFPFCAFPQMKLFRLARLLFTRYQPMNVNPSGVALIPVFTALVWIPVPQMAVFSLCSSPVTGSAHRADARRKGTEVLGRDIKNESFATDRAAIQHDMANARTACDQPVGDEFGEGSAHDEFAYAKCLRQRVARRQPVAGAQTPIRNPIAQLALDLLGQRAWHRAVNAERDLSHLHPCSARLIILHRSVKTVPEIGRTRAFEKRQS